MCIRDRALDGDMTFKEAEQYVVNEAGNSRYPVYGEDIDDIIGILHIRDMLAVTLERGAECAGLPLREVPGLLLSLIHIFHAMWNMRMSTSQASP